MNLTKSGLAIMLSQLETFRLPSIKAEQYSTDSESAAELLWFAHMHRNIEDKIICDLGAGTGILGLGALILGAKRVYFVENCRSALKTARSNLEHLEKIFNLDLKKKARFICSDIKDFSEKCDTVIQNPPFGTKTPHADRLFLEKAFQTSECIYSVHKIESEKFISRFASEHSFRVTHILPLDLQLRISMPHHRRRVLRVRVGCWRLCSSVLAGSKE